MATGPYAHVIRMADVPEATGIAVDVVPSAEDIAAIAVDLELSALRKVSLRGKLAPLGRRDWRFEGVMGATVVQPCVVSLEPVTTRLDVPVART